MSEDTKKAAIREAYRSYVLSHYGKDVGELSDLQRSIALVQLYVSTIHNRTKAFISEDDIERCCVDGSNDLGVDFIHRDDGVVTIIQAKYAKNSNLIAKEDIEHFQGVLRRLANPSFKMNSKLEELIGGIDLATDTVYCYFISLGRLDGQAKIQAGLEPLLPSGYAGLADRLTFEYLDESRLNEELRNALILGSTDTVTPVTITSAGTTGNRSGIVEISASGKRSIVMVVDAKQITGLWQQFKDSLFTLNIRNYGNNILDSPRARSVNEQAAD